MALAAAGAVALTVGGYKVVTGVSKGISKAGNHFEKGRAKKEAKRHKPLGDEAFAQRHFQEAIRHYTAAVTALGLQ